MTKEELLEMVDATISGNGKQEITGHSLNLALTEIINAMGTGSGGGGLMIHYLPRHENSTASGEEWQGSNIEDVLNDPSINFPYREQLQKCIEDNVKIYNILMDCYNNKTPIPGPIYFDTTFYDGYFQVNEDAIRGGVATYWFYETSYDVPFIELGSMMTGQ
jgi:hypothetical protein